MKRTRIIPHPFNYGFTLEFEVFPKEFVEVLKAPGKFVKKANTQVKLANGKTGVMDAPYIADPDGKKIFERTAVILEHQRIAVHKDKNYMISNYVIQITADEKLPYHVSVASHLDKEKHQQEYARTGSFIIRLDFLDLGERDNWERLNSIRNKLRFNKNLSIKDGLNLGIVVLFAPEDCAMERTREAMHYLLESKINSKKLEFVLYSVFYCMIDAYFDDEKEYERMMSMLKNNTSNETKEKFESEIRLENRLNQVITERDKFSAEKDLLKEKADKLSAENDLLKEKTDKLSARIDNMQAMIAAVLSGYIEGDEKTLKEKLKPYESVLKEIMDSTPLTIQKQHP